MQNSLQMRRLQKILFQRSTRPSATVKQEMKRDSENTCCGRMQWSKQKKSSKYCMATLKLLNL